MPRSSPSSSTTRRRGRS
ncbi:unnamed protein product [Linum tenue]|uniref:Uncharacterized protein n=1 Tax=Linum tenue TaxID=586396 RepID=A0AAV0JPB6_9ROSI|nr:unnamed protein product [Linum tenue]CAI0410562.1 unnamed protein product [Linum tenue]CAI0465467.1 unnamed protein product [Linum tenue]